MNIPDKTHADWLLTSQECLIKGKSPSLSTEITTIMNEKFLTIKRISAVELSRMEFITNTDQNNNYMYLCDLSIYKDNSFAPLNTGVIEPILIKMFSASDTSAFINNKIKHSPFLPRNFKTSNGFRGALSPFIKRMSIHLPSFLCPNLNNSSLSFDITLKINE